MEVMSMLQKQYQYYRDINRPALDIPVYQEKFLKFTY
jgi:hypothetical protein